jgi:hypothetical protein
MSLAKITRSIVVPLAAAAIAANTAGATGGPPGYTSGTQCAVQCITKALVTTTATAAKVEIATTVPTKLAVSVAKAPAGGNAGGVAAQPKTVTTASLALSRTVFFLNLDPDTTYSIAVKASDAYGQTATRLGSFKTLAIKTNGLGGPDTIDSGLGCSVACITKALFTQTRPYASMANVELATATDAKIKFFVSLDKPIEQNGALVAFQIVSSQSSPGFVRSWQSQIGGLLAGTKYYVVVRATDTQGRISVRQGSFRTVSATAVVTIQKIKVVNDGDKGSNKGELLFRYFRGGTEWTTSNDFAKIGSGQVVTAKVYGTSRPGVMFSMSANGDAKLDVGVTAEECDTANKKKCPFEAGGPAGNQYTHVGGRFDLGDILSPTLPGWYGSGVTPPPGHDGYFMFGPGDRYVKILVLATVDVHYDWPS